MIQGAKGRIAFVAVDLEQDPMCDLLGPTALLRMIDSIEERKLLKQWAQVRGEPEGPRAP